MGGLGDLVIVVFGVLLCIWFGGSYKGLPISETGNAGGGCLLIITFISVIIDYRTISSFI